VEIANQKFGIEGQDLHLAVAHEVMRYRKAAKKAGFREPSTGEYIDALEVCRDLNIDTQSKVWADVARNVLWKQESKPKLENSNDEES
jgi:hypothetical protein